MNMSIPGNPAPRSGGVALPPAACAEGVEKSDPKPREDQRQRTQTMRHLRDILEAHGAGKRWPSLAIPEGRLVRIDAPEPLASPCGSTAALCADEGDSISL